MSFLKKQNVPPSFVTLFISTRKMCDSKDEGERIKMRESNTFLKRGININVMSLFKWRVTSSVLKWVFLQSFCLSSKKRVMKRSLVDVFLTTFFFKNCCSKSFSVSSYFSAYFSARKRSQESQDLKSKIHDMIIIVISVSVDILVLNRVSRFPFLALFHDFPFWLFSSLVWEEDNVENNDPLIVTVMTTTSTLLGVICFFLNERSNYNHSIIHVMNEATNMQ